MDKIIPDGAILCRRCGKIISINYDKDRFHAGTELYQHDCGKPLPEEVTSADIQQ